MAGKGKTDRMERVRAVGINHVALEVGSIDEALEFFGRLFDVRLRGRGERMAFIDLGDQFLALFEGRDAHVDGRRHFGLVVDDKQLFRRRLEDAGVEPLPGRFLDFLDPWGNHVQVVEYGEIRFEKTRAVLASMGLGPLTKQAGVRKEGGQTTKAAE